MSQDSQPSAVPEAPKASNPKNVGHARRSLTHRFIDMLKRNPKKSIALAGLGIASFYKNRQVGSDKHKKKVLVLPFYKMNIVEESTQDIRSLSRSNFSKEIEMPADELVKLIHSAAEDPNIVALYGIFGNGNGFRTGGWAHVEEIRNALLVFQQSHRCHKEPNIAGASLEQQQKSQQPRTPKPLYAYANTFASPLPGSGGMKEYYLASAFTHIHLQSQGDLELFGLHSTNWFYRDFLKKYGIQVNVFKHGLYKDFGNLFTHARYTKEHKENVQNIFQNWNNHVCYGIYTSRNKSLKQFEFSNFWEMVHRAGSFPADLALKVGFIDYVPRLDPLDKLLENGKKEAKFSTEDKSSEENAEEKWGSETDLDHFAAEAKISITDYARQKKQEKGRLSKQWNVYKLFSSMGNNASHKKIPQEDASKNNEEKIAVIKLGGGITEATARKTERTLKKLKNSKEVKAVVLRVDSPGGVVTACETIYQEIQDLPQKVVVSFGNVSASGGYYISANADRIFASPTTVTGSIGVFMIRFDFRGLAEQYGITFDSVATSELSGCFDPLEPINEEMKENFQNSVDRTYLRFKSLVAAGRDMDLDAVENIAQGRLWTGEQAKQIGLVDELGGLDRAIAFCQRNYTESGEATVVSWPPKQSLLEFFLKRMGGSDDDMDDFQVPSILHFFFSAFQTQSMGISRFFPKAEGSVIGTTPRFPAAFSGVMLTTDENWAIRCALQDNDVTDMVGNFPPSFWE